MRFTISNIKYMVRTCPEAVILLELQDKYKKAQHVTKIVLSEDEAIFTGLLFGPAL